MAIRHDTAVADPAAEIASPRPYVLGEDGKVHLERAPGPGEPPPDHYAVLGLPRRLLLDPDAIEIRFRSLMRDLHPDRFHVQGPQAVANAQRHASLVNDAHRVLRDFERRLAYLLDVTGEGGADDRFRPPPALLSQVLEANEALDAIQEALANGDETAAARARQELAETTSDLRSARKAVAQRMLEAAGRWDAAQGPDAPADAEAAARKDLRAALGEATYLDNLLRRIEAAGLPPGVLPTAAPGH